MKPILRVIVLTIVCTLNLAPAQEKKSEPMKNNDFFSTPFVLDSFEHSTQAETELICQLQKDSTQLMIYYSLALLNFKNTTYTKALQYADAGLLRAGNGIDSLRFTMLKSEISLAMKKPEQAIQAFEYFVPEDFPLFISYYHYLLGRCYFYLENVELSRKHFTLLNQDIRYSKLARTYLDKLERLDFDENK